MNSLLYCIITCPKTSSYKLYLTTSHFCILVQVRFVNPDGTDNSDPCSPFRIKFPTNVEGRVHFLPSNERSRSSNNSSAMEDDHSDKLELLVESYIPSDPGPYPQDQPKQNSVRFTPTQVLEIIFHINGVLVD